MSEGHIAENIRTDLAAGFDRVVSLIEDRAAIERFRAKAGDLPVNVLVG
jgi:hypothetical protein